VNKHIIGYGAAALALLLLGYCWLKAHDAWHDLQGDLKAGQVRVKNNDATVATAQKTVDAAATSNQQIDDKTARQIAGLQQQLNSKPDSAQIRAIVQDALPGVKTVEAKDAQGNSVLAVADTQANRDAINQAEVSFKSCRFELDGCQQKQKNFLDVIAAKDQQLAAKDDSIKTLKENLDRAQKASGTSKGFKARAGEWLLRGAIAYGSYKVGQAGKK
jgi:predicted secreted protein